MNMNQSPVRIVLSNNPLNRFMSEGEVGKNDMDFQYKFHTVEESKYVVDLIGDDWYNWNPETPVMISAQTGTGKNTFINKTILRSVVTYNREHSSPLKLLLVLNRAALRRQTLIKIAQIIVEYTGNTHWRDELDNYTDSGLDKNFYEMGNICIVTYQYLSSDSGINILSKNIFQYAIFDECHFFTSDALFNPNTDTILNNIVQHCSNAIRIYMSATIETAFEPITRAEYRMWHRKKEASTNSDDIIATTNQKIASSYALQTGNYDTTRRIDGEQIQRFIDSNKKFKVKFYDLERDYSYVEKIQVVSCSTLEETIEKEGGKWIIFVGCREDGKQIKSALEGKNIKTSFLTRDSKTSSVFNDLVKEECFQSQVLIATSVIDNGINIKDGKITDIVIFPFDRVEFLQMLGRLRIGDKTSTKLHIWVASWEEKELKELLKGDLKNSLTGCFWIPWTKKQEMF